MTIYTYLDARLTWVGSIAPCSIHDPLGPSYVHVFGEYRDEFSLLPEPYDMLFDTYMEALEWADGKLGGILVGY